ncbi:YDG domain-containing protein [Sphaerotilus uruguayifluvii]|uniref:Filamentous hemagglutinin family protein n=1 Tax=Sphaerotilus uruguayifluvii TaxID=2735897 RepID=A0ABX2G1F5_9BURK|nr:YDG domain-containing protein [Leptothrix sp. C29]NRT55254.1 filamentous hemagglutinin family protein [Leptothrix sp. C29]
MKNRGPGAINRVYRLVWNEATGTHVAVAEHCSGRGKGRSGMARLLLAATLTGAAALPAQAAPPAAGALPQGGVTVQGQAQWTQSGSRLQVDQGSSRAAIDWQRFDIGSQAEVRFNQPSSSAVMLNRVTGADPSQIFGRLSANGQVLMVNPNGIVFGKGSQVDVGGLVASTLNLSDADFMAGRLRFTRGAGSAGVINEGELRAADGGYVALLAPEVRNQGLVRARLGTVALAGGDAVTLDLQGDRLLGVRVDPATLRTLVENGQAIEAEGGQVILAAGAARQLQQQAVAGAGGASELVERDGVVRLVVNTGRIGAAGGQVTVQGGQVDLGGSIAARDGGTVRIEAAYVGQSGSIDVSSSQAAGGTVQVGADTVVQTAGAQVLAEGATAGGTVRIAGPTGGAAGSILYSSATLSARGTGEGARGGAIDLTAASVQLRAATVDASGTAQGGRVRAGGGFHGADADLGNAGALGVNASTVLRADATGAAGQGGEVVAWSDGRTVFAGSISARGGSRSGAGGTAEVSGHEALVFQGSADLSSRSGEAGRLLLDPRNILVDNAGTALASLEMSDPTPDAGNGFGSTVSVLSNGNVVVTAPQAATGALAQTGAAYLFSSSSGALLSNLRGTSAGDKVGSGGIRLLGSGHYLVLSPDYGTVAGRTVTGFEVTDSTGNRSAPAPSGIYALQSGASASAGAITWQSRTGSGSALVSATNSLVGSTANTDSMVPHGYSGQTVTNQAAVTVTANDRLGAADTLDGNLTSVLRPGTRITELADGNLAIAVPTWYNGRGAVAWMNASTGVLADGSGGGAISAGTALVGTTPNRTLAPVSTSASDATKKVYVLGQRMPYNPDYYGVDQDRFDASAPVSLTDNGVNRRSTPPGAAGDMIGLWVTALPGGAYVVNSPLWSNGAATYAGAVTWGGSGGAVGAVGTGNSLVGSSAYDFVGSGGVSKVGSGGANYLVGSQYWSGNGNAAAGRFLDNNPDGAVTWVDGSNGHAFGAASSGAAVGAANSLIGSAGDTLGSLSSSLNTYVTTANDYNSTSYVSTWTYASRLQAGSNGLKLLTNGNYLVVDTAWNSGRGAVSFGTGAAGLAGVVASGNSLVGSSAQDKVGASVVELSGGNYVVASPDWDNGAAVNAGAVTWGSGSSGRTGSVGSGNSLVGSGAYDQVGSGGVLPVGSLGSDGLRASYIVLSPQWGNRGGASASTVAYGAVTWVRGSDGQITGAAGTGAAVSATNSLVGDHAGDYVGSVHYADSRSGSWSGDGYYLQPTAWDAVLTSAVEVLSNGDYVVRSPGWDSGKGAATLGSGSTGVAGTIGAANSLVGAVSDVIATTTSSASRAGSSWTDTTSSLTTTGDHVGLLGGALAGGAYLVVSPFWGSGKGAVTWLGSGNTAGTVSSANSLVGSTADSFGNASHTTLTAVGDRLGTLASSQWTTPVVSTATIGGQTATTTTSRPVGPYASASAYEVRNNAQVLLGRNYGVTAPRSLNLQDDGYGGLYTDFQLNVTPIYQALSGGNLLVASPNWNNGAATQAGAVTWINGSTGLLADGSRGGTLSASNSLVGSHTADYIGLRLPVDGVTELGNGNFVLANPQWHSERGAVTWGSGTAGVTGTISDANSLVGTTPSSDMTVSTTYTQIAGMTTASDYVYRHIAGKGWNSDWPDRATSKDGDRVGFGGVTALADGNAVVASPFWGSTGAWTMADAPPSKGAATWIDGGTGRLIDGASGGAVSAANSLVGRVAGDAVTYSAYVDDSSGAHSFYGGAGITALAGGRYVVSSPWWSDGAATGAGAVTFGAAGGVAGEVSIANSLVGSTSGDHVGMADSMLDPVTWVSTVRPGVVTVTSGGQTNYVVRSWRWTNADDRASGGAQAGAITWVDGTTGRAYGESSSGAAVGLGNSLVGSVAGDQVGAQYVALQDPWGSATTPTGDLLFYSNLAYCGEAGYGAVTLLSGAQGAAGRIGWRNSLLGLAPTSGGQDTSTLGVNSMSSDLRALVLPGAVTSAERVGGRPLVWAAPNANSGSNSTRLYAMTLVDESASGGRIVDPVHAAGASNWSGSLLASSTAGYVAAGGSGTSGLLGFSANASTDIVITPATLTGLLDAGTDVTLQASNDITVARAIRTSAGGQGGDLTLEAGRSIRIDADITTDNGNLTLIANQSVVAGVVDTACSSCTSEIVQRAGTVLDAGTGQVSVTLAKSTDKTANAAGDVLLASVDGQSVSLINAGLSASGAGRGLRFQSGAVIGSGTTQSLRLEAGGESASGGGIVLAGDTQLVGASGATLQAAAADATGQARFGATGGDFAMTAAEMGAIVSQSSGFSDLRFGRADQSGATVLAALDFSQAAMKRGGATLDADLMLQGGSGGLSAGGAIVSGAATDRHLALKADGGTLALGAVMVTAGTGHLVLDTGTGGAVTQGAGGTLAVGRLLLQGSGSATLTGSGNAIGTLAGQIGTASVKNAASTLTVGTVGATSGLAFVSGGTLQAAGAGSDVVLDQPVATTSGLLVIAAGRNVVNNNATDTGLQPGSGRYLVYSSSPSGTTEGMSTYAKHYNQSYVAGSTPAYAGSGNWFLYSVAPTLTASVGAGSTITYGDPGAAPGVNLTGFIDGDTQASATSGSLASTTSSYTASGAGFIPVGTYTVTLTGQGTLASSLGYQISVTSGSSSFTVNPKAVAVSGLSAASKVYDGSTSAVVSGSGALTGGGASSGDGKVMSGDAVAFGGTAAGAFADRHVGTGKSVTLSGVSLSGADAANYTVSAGSVTADITPKSLSVSGTTAANKVYDGTTAATLSGGTLVGVVGSDAVTLTQAGSFADRNAGSGKTVTASDSLGGLDAGNYTLVQPSGLSADITRKAITISGTVAAGKTYDGTSAATVSGGSLGGLIGGDTVNITGSFADRNAGSGKTVTLALDGADAGNYDISGSGQTQTSADITPKSLSVSGTTAANKVYDGTTAATLSGGTLVGVVGSDAVTLTQAGSFADRNAGSGKAVTASDSLGGVDAGNYTLVQPTGLVADITPKSLSVSGTTAANKVYDGTTAATLSGGTLVGVVGSDAVTLTQAGSFADRNAGGGKAVTASDSLGGLDAGNYTLVQPTGLAADITPKSLSVSGTTAANKVYDGTTTATLSGGTLVGVVGSDAVTLTQAGSFADRNAGSGKAVTASDSLGGLDAGNYTLVQPSGLSADITRKAITISGTVAAGKTYDGTSAATVSGGSLGGLIGGDTVNITGSFADRNAGSGKTVTLALDGADAGNYDISGSGQTQTSADITPKSLSVSGTTAANKVYDGTTAATLSGGTLVGVVGSDVVTLTQAGSFADRNAGSGKAVTASDSLGGVDAGNYTLVQPTGLVADITPKAVTLGGASAADRVYDGTTAAAVSGGSLVGRVGSDAVNVIGSFVDRNAGSGKTVTLALDGADAGNYVLSGIGQTQTSASITPKSLSVSGTVVANKVYDGTTTATLSGGALVGVVGSDAVTLTQAGSFADRNAGSGKAVTASDSLGGLDAGNYTLVQPSGLSADITRKAITISGTVAAGKTYDGTSAATVSGGSLGGLIGGDTVNITGSFADRNAGSGKTVTLALDGADAGNYDISGSGQTQTSADIAPRPVTLGGTVAVGKTYDGTSAATLGGGSIGGLVDGDSVVIAGQFADRHAGSGKTVTLSLAGTDARNYVVSGAGQTQVTADIAPRPVTLQGAISTGKTYDGTTAITVSGGALVGVVEGDAVTLSRSGHLADRNAGTGKAVISTSTLGGADAGDYALVQPTGLVADVAPRELAIVAADQRKVYGDPDVAPGFSVGGAGLAQGDAAAAVLSGSLGTARGAEATAGTHAITLGTLTVDANYRITAFVPATLTVDKAALTVSMNPVSKVYGAEDPVLTWSVEAGQLRHADGASVVRMQATTAAGAQATAGTHVVSGQASADNYEIRVIDGTLTVTRAPLTVTADDQARTAGEPGAALTWRVDSRQLRHADTAGVVSGVVLDAPQGAGVPPGSYPIRIASASAANYELTLVDGTLTVKPSPAVKAENLQGQVGSGVAAPRTPPVSPAGTGAGAGVPGSLTVVGGGLSSGAAPATSTAAGAGSGAGDAAAAAAANRSASTSLSVLRPAFQFGAADLGSGVACDALFNKPEGASVTYSAVQADGSPLPSWVAFDSRSGVLRSAAPAGERVDGLDIRVTAKTQDGQSATSLVQLRMPQ